MPHGAIPFPFGDCRVCTDKATGVHYGVATCEGCKGFFKRSLIKAEKFRCFYKGQCNLSPADRNRCKSCRFQKCLSVGMSVEGVKMGRIPKVEKEKALIDHQRELQEKAASSQGVAGDVPSGNGQDVGTRYLQTGGVLYRDVAYDSRIVDNNSIKGQIKDPSYPRDFPDQKALHNRSTVPESISFERDRNEILSHGNEIGLYETERYRGWRGDVAPGSYSDSGSGIHANMYHRHASGVDPDHSLHFNDEVYMDRFEKRGDFSVASKFSPPGYTHCYRPRRFSLQTPQSWTLQQESFEKHAPSGGSDAVASMGGHDPYNPERIHRSKSDGNCRDVFQFIRNKEMPALQRIYDDDDHDDDELYKSAVHGKCSFSSGSRWISSDEPSSGSEPSKSLSPFYPTVIKEILSQVMETGHTQELQHCLVKQFMSSSSSSMSDPLTSNKSYYQKSTICDSYSVQNSSGNPFYKPAKRKSEIIEELDESVVGLNLANKKTRLGTEDETGISKLATDGLDLVIASDHGLFSGQRVSCVSSAESTSVLSSSSSSPSGSWKTMDIVETNESVPSEYSKSVDIKRKCNNSTDTINSTSIDDISKDVLELKLWNAPTSSIVEGAIERENEIGKVLVILEKAAKDFLEFQEKCLIQYEEEMKKIKPIHPMNMLTDPTNDELMGMWNELMASVPESNANILGLCSQIPGFDQLDVKDRATLMENAYFDLWLFSACRLFIDGDYWGRVPCGARYSRFWMEMFLPNSFVQKLFNFAYELNSLNLSDLEVIILSAIQLTDDKNKTMVDLPRVQQLHDYYLDILAYQISQTHTKNHSHVLIKVFQLLPMLTPIGLEQANIIMNFHVNHPPGVSMSSCCSSLGDKISEEDKSKLDVTLEDENVKEKIATDNENLSIDRE